MKTLISEQEIQEKVLILADRINNHYASIPIVKENIVIVVVLTGAFVFAADIMKLLNFPFQVDFIKLRSYNKDISNNVQIISDISIPLENSHVLVIEDILDTGNTINTVLNLFNTMNKPKSVETCILLRRLHTECTHIPTFYGFTLHDTKFIAGYGLDFDEKFRHLPNIVTIKE